MAIPLQAFFSISLQVSQVLPQRVGQGAGGVLLHLRDGGKGKGGGGGARGSRRQGNLEQGAFGQGGGADGRLEQENNFSVTIYVLALRLCFVVYDIMLPPSRSNKNTLHCISFFVTIRRKRGVYIRLSVFSRRGFDERCATLSHHSLITELQCRLSLALRQKNRTGRRKSTTRCSQTMARVIRSGGAWKTITKAVVAICSTLLEVALFCLVLACSRAPSFCSCLDGIRRGYECLLYGREDRTNK